jgi:rhamnose utilization protein RhaD (predicted bifunctional aldolase and dehydrogenase)
MDQANLIKLRDHSVFVGSNPDLVQASGGNTSWKSDSTVWVKGSGKRLKDALSEDIFSVIKFDSLTEDGIAACQDFSTLTSNSMPPSIEANFHILIKNNFVTHLHSLGAVSLSVSDESIRNQVLNSDLSFIPYCRPGIDLAQAIRQTINYQKNILVLQNHGIILSDSSCVQIEKKLELFEKSIRNLFESLNEVPHFPDWIEILVSGVLTPDEAVFLGKVPFAKSDAPLIDSISINHSGELLFSQNLSNDRIEMAHFYVRVAKMISKKTRVNYLPTSEVESLLGWDKEIKRIELAK